MRRRTKGFLSLLSLLPPFAVLGKCGFNSEIQMSSSKSLWGGRGGERRVEKTDQLDCNLSRFFYCEIEVESLDIQVMSKWRSWSGVGVLELVHNAKDFPAVPNSL